jgi:hypothetical protein
MFVIAQMLANSGAVAFLVVRRGRAVNEKNLENQKRHR